MKAKQVVRSLDELRLQMRERVDARRRIEPGALRRAACQIEVHLEMPGLRGVQSREEIAECFAMSGEWDYLVRVVVRDVADYERFLMRELLKHPTIATAASHFALSQVKYTTALPV